MVARRSYAIVFAFVVMLLSLTLISFGTYALFTSQRQFSGHLESGTLDVVVTRVQSKASYLEPERNGRITIVSNNDAVVLSDETDVNNAFGLPETCIIAPTCKEIATFTVTHGEKSNVAFDYYIKFIVTAEQKNTYTTTDSQTQEEVEKALQFAEQLKVTVEILGEKDAVTFTKDFTVDELEQAIKALSEPVATVEVGDTSKFRVTVEFLDKSKYDEETGALDETQLDNENNTAMNQKVYFDMLIIAKQAYTYDNPGQNDDLQP